ncbi:MAG: acyl carrier protein [Halodesulfovibrio sp.]
MTHDPILHGVCTVIAEVLDLDAATLTAETYVFRDLDTESIDLLEYGIGMGRHFGIRMQDSVAFLKDLRVHIAHADSQTEDANGEQSTGNPSANLLPARREQRIAHLRTVYPHLTEERLAAMLDDLAASTNARPVLRIGDIVAYVRHALGQ